MKNQKKKAFSFFTLFLLLVLSTSIKAQNCSADWRVENATDCQARVRVDIYCNGNLCVSQTQTIPSGNTAIYQPCGFACNPCDVKVTLLDLGSCNGLNITVDSANPQLSWDPPCSVCPPQGGTQTDIIFQQGPNLTTIGQ